MRGLGGTDLKYSAGIHAEELRKTTNSLTSLRQYLKRADLDS
jgi:hypothetical protein